MSFIGLPFPSFCVCGCWLLGRPVGAVGGRAGGKREGQMMTDAMTDVRRSSSINEGSIVLMMSPMSMPMHNMM